MELPAFMTPWCLTSSRQSCCASSPSNSSVCSCSSPHGCTAVIAPWARTPAPHHQPSSRWCIGDVVSLCYTAAAARGRGGRLLQPPCGNMPGDGRWPAGRGGCPAPVLLSRPPAAQRFGGGVWGATEVDTEAVAVGSFL